MKLFLMNGIGLRIFKMEEIQISVIIPVYNSSRYITEAIESVLQQTVPPQEIIVVDDGSDDETKQVLQKFKSQITYIYQENSGPAAARNRGLAEARGTFISFLDADDIWQPKKIEILLKEFEKQDDLGVALGLVNKMHFDSVQDITPKDLCHHHFSLVLGCSLVKKNVFDIVGGFDEDLILSDDTDWFFRVRENNIRISIQREIVLHYRLHDNNLTKNKDIYKSSILRVLKKAKDRKQQSEVMKTFALHKPSDMDELIELWNTV